MKTLKQVFKEANLLLREDEEKDDTEEQDHYGGETTGTAGSDNWSMSAADLNKQANDPTAKAQMTQHNANGVSTLVKRFADTFPSSVFAGMNDNDLNLFAQRMQQQVDATVWQAKKDREKMSQEPGTNVGGMPQNNTQAGKGNTQILPK